MQSLIQVSSLTKKYGSFTAVNELSFSVQKGDVYGFLGQNGAGKSTTIRMLMTLIEPTAGDIRIFDLPLSTHRKEILRQTGAVIEKPEVYPYLSAYDNLRLFARLSGV
ncbi:MAG: ATP-binding cassette domain-containing protein, partial [Chitinophagaceae bacterium]|nr:ATP-binding cassette domain-containing protein [Chitinophagaceae bacterium]MCA6483936.1 ATP-binding cassette domain-containing protein [Chitinophagaceae bacterium]